MVAKKFSYSVVIHMNYSASIVFVINQNQKSSTLISTRKFTNKFNASSHASPTFTLDC